MLEALRGLGYSAAGALADIIDNSIAAGAREVCLSFVWNEGSSRIAILDDGCGMDESTLENAMRLGSRSPLQVRSAHDLGRFGLGLKTASFSQCRRLTVASKCQGKITVFQWDLDVLAVSDGGWHLLEGAGNADDLVSELLGGQTSGTLVVWDCLDRIVTNGCTAQDFLDLVDRIQAHLEMVFHRYLECDENPLVIRINGRSISPWNPFLSEHPATWSSPTERVQSGEVSIDVTAYVLPHKDRLTPEEQQRYAGPDGWTAQQGFYVYRNKRLLVAGNWLGLGQGKAWTKEEPFRLARIRLDIPNSADSEWKIDIRKATARPPIAVRKRLSSIADDARQRARRVFAHRGGIVRSPGSQEAVPLWRSEHTRAGVRYRIQKEHPLVHAVLEDAGELKPQILSLMRVIEETIPVQKIWLDTAEAKETPLTRFAGEPTSEVLSVLQTLYSNLVHRRGLSAVAAKERLLRTEPFQDYAELVWALPDYPEEKIS